MREIQVLLFDWDAASGLGNALTSLLVSSHNPSFKVEQEFLSESHYSQEFCGLFDNLQADLIFVIPPPAGNEKVHLLLKSMGSRLQKCPVLLLLKESHPDEIIRMLRLGVSDFLLSPLREDDIFPRIWRLLIEPKTDDKLVQNLKARIGLENIVGQSPMLLAELEKIQIVANCDVSVLISGETGTGKELFARAIHYLSLRANKAFIPVSCGAIPPDLLENELFGHSQGAYTGAVSSQPGLIQEAGKGSLFLDDVDCLPLQAQTKLLRFLQEKEYKPLGSVKIQNADVRVMAATNIELEKAVQSAKFRRDLFYRLNVIPIKLPPLRNRGGDILQLARHFLKKYSFEHNKRIPELDVTAAAKLLSYSWPGNIRELEHIMERAVIFSSHPTVRDTDILLPQSEPNSMHDSLRVAKSKAIRHFEKKFIEDLLMVYQGNITASAKAAGKNRRAFWELIRKYKINAESYRPQPSAKHG